MPATDPRGSSEVISYSPSPKKHIAATIFFHSRSASATIASSSLTPGAATMIRLGIIDFDTSHVVEFTKRLNHKGIDKDQWVDGAEITLGCPGDSQLAPERIAGYKKEMESLGIELVKNPADLIGKVDGVLVESLEGGAHLARAKLFLEAGMPCYVDKPFACTVADARAMVQLSEKHKAPLFSASSLRYAPELTAFVADDAHGKIIGAVAY